MTYRFLTRSFVDWLGLPLIPIHKRRNQGYVAMPDGGCLPLPQAYPGWAQGVEFRGALYEQEHDGLAYRRLDD